MAYHTDHSRPDGLHSTGRFNRHRDAPQSSDSMWVIAGLVALVLIISGLFMFGQKGELSSPNPSAQGTTQSAPASRPAPPALPAR